MSTNTSPPTQQPPSYGPGQPPRKRHRVFLWVFLAIQVIFLIWVISAGVSAPQNGVDLEVELWVLTDVIIGVIYLICQLPRRLRTADRR